MIQEPPPELENPWLAKELKDLIDWCRRHHPFAADNSIQFEEKTDGLSTRVGTTDASAIIPFTIVKLSDDKRRIVAGYVGDMLGDTTTTNGSITGMSPAEDGTTANPYFEIDVILGDTIYIAATVSVSGSFWRIDSTQIISASTVPDADNVTAILPLGVVTEDGVGSPQTNIGNQWWTRLGTTDDFVDIWQQKPTE